MSSLSETVSSNLKKLREKSGMSQEDFADGLKISTSYLSMIERGTRELTLEGIEKVAHNLGIDPLDLLKAPRGKKKEASAEAPW